MTGTPSRNFSVRSSVAETEENLRHIHQAHSQILAQLRDLDQILAQIACYGEACRALHGLGAMGMRCAQLQDCLAQHFRREEALFNRLQARRQETQAMVQTLTREHRTLERSLAILVLALKALNTGDELPLSLYELEDETRELIQTLERHIATEKTLLPLLETTST